MPTIFAMVYMCVYTDKIKKDYADSSRYLLLKWVVS